MATNASEPIVEALLEALVDALNRHDAASVSATFALDADLVNWRGRVLHGREAITSFLTSALSGPFAAAKFCALEHRVRFLSDTIAAVDLLWHVAGARSPDGSARPDHRGLMDGVAAKSPTGGWWIVVGHLRDLPPEVPKGSAGPARPGSASR